MVIISEYGIRPVIRRKRFSCMPRFGLYEMLCKFIENNCRSYFSHWMLQKMKLWTFFRNLAKSMRLIAYRNGRDELKSSLYYSRNKWKPPYIEWVCCKISIYFVFSLFQAKQCFLSIFFISKLKFEIKQHLTHSSLVNSAFLYVWRIRSQMFSIYSFFPWKCWWSLCRSHRRRFACSFDFWMHVMKMSVVLFFIEIKESWFLFFDRIKSKLTISYTISPMVCDCSNFIGLN